jgi:hypothetical protein
MKFNLSHRRGYFTCHKFNIKKFYVMLTLLLCVVYEFQKDAVNFPHATLTDWFYITEVESVHCAVSAEFLCKTEAFRL